MLRLLAMHTCFFVFGIVLMPATSLPTSSRLEKRATPICEPLMRQIPFDYSDCVAAIAYINANSYNTNGEIQIFGPVYGANERFNKKKWTYDTCRIELVAETLVNQETSWNKVKAAANAIIHQCVFDGKQQGSTYIDRIGSDPNFNEPANLHIWVYPVLQEDQDNSSIYDSLASSVDTAVSSTASAPGPVDGTTSSREFVDAPLIAGVDFRAGVNDLETCAKQHQQGSFSVECAWDPLSLSTASFKAEVAASSLSGGTG